jgi:hypothetical protein
MTPHPKQSALPDMAKEISALVGAIGGVIFYWVGGLATDHSWISAVIALAAGTAVAGFVLLYCYIYGDARRRNMNAPLWTVLALFAPSGIGIILYFIFREPLANFCAKCGAVAQSGFAYCPQCGASLSNVTCPQCHRIPEPGWTHCASCGAKL